MKERIVDCSPPTTSPPTNCAISSTTCTTGSNDTNDNGPNGTISGYSSSTGNPQLVTFLAIDYVQLYRDEKRKVKEAKAKANANASPSTSNEPPTIVPPASTPASTTVVGKLDNNHNSNNNSNLNNEYLSSYHNNSFPRWPPSTVKAESVGIISSTSTSTSLSSSSSSSFPMRDATTKLTSFNHILLLSNKKAAIGCGQDDNDYNDIFHLERYCVCTRNPHKIYYYCPKPHGIIPYEDSIALVQWLQLLPENATTATYTTTATTTTPTTTTSSPNNTKDSTSSTSEILNGKWNVLKHSKRRVALFTTTATSKETINENLECTSLSFPEPLERIVHWLVENGIFDFDDTDDNNIADEQFQNDDACNDHHQQHQQQQNQHNPLRRNNTKQIIRRRPNHILVNEYCGDTSGILPHTDGPIYYPRTATISIGGNVILNFIPTQQQNKDNQQRNNVVSCDDNNSNTDYATTPCTVQNEETNSISPRHKRSVVLSGNPSSLVVFCDEAYTDYMHGINDTIESFQSSSTTTTATTNAATTESPTNTSTTGSTDGSYYYESTGSHCVNALPNTIIQREPYRISLTFRVQK